MSQPSTQLSPPVPPNEAPRRTRRGEDRDAALRARAAELFLERGYDGVSIDDVIRAVGGSKSNVYSFYGGKEGLFLVAMRDTIVSLAAELDDLNLAGLPIETGLDRFARKLLSLLLHPRHLAFQRLLTAEGRKQAGLGATWYEAGPAKTHRQLAAYLEERRGAQEIAQTVDCATMSVLFHDMVAFDLLIRALMATDGGPTAEQIDATVRAAIAVLIAALRPVSAPGAIR